MGPLWGGGWVLWGCYGVPAWVLWGGSAGTQPPPPTAKTSGARGEPMGAGGDSAPYGSTREQRPLWTSTNSAPYGSTREQHPL